MASFPIQAQQYDGATVEATIADMEQELADETSLRSTLDATTGDKILAAQKFREDNEALIGAQLTRLKDLDTQIRSAVTENEELEADDAEYQALITSEPYQKLADDIASLQAISSSLADFLVAKGRRGRPPLN
jgi:hypothetical protein